MGEREDECHDEGEGVEVDVARVVRRRERTPGEGEGRGGDECAMVRAAAAGGRRYMLSTLSSSDRRSALSWHAGPRAKRTRRG